MKRIRLNGGAGTHDIALRYFALAHRAKHVDGAPRWLFSLRLSPADVVKYAYEGKLRIDPWAQTLGFTQNITPDNYPGMRDPTLRPIDGITAEHVLQMGYNLLKVDARAV